VSSWPAIARRIRVPLGFAFAVFYIWLARPTPPSIALGGALALPGLILRALASGYVEKNEQLTTNGPYAYTRNPLYLGSLIIAAGFAVAARRWWIAAAMLLLFVAIYLPVIQSEEEFLRQRFPQFSDYARQVPRLWPRMPSLGNRGGSFSWDLYRKHREYNAIIGSVTLIAALAAKLLWISY
jgi:protein-S-isoprenylcysteine O-methyltransferase Ste14